MSSCGNNFNGNIVLNSTASFDPTKITINSSDLTKLGVAKVITGDSVTFNLTPLVGGNGTNGVDGREIELQKTATHIQWRYVGATNVWNNLVLLTEITGPQGIQGIQGIQGVTGTAGSNGTNGASSYTYIGYADDATGTGFTTTFAETKNFIAIKATTNPIATPVAADFTGLWKNYKGATGATGPAGATYTHPNHTGEVTSTGDGATSIALNAVTNTKLADMPTTTIKGRQTTDRKSVV